MQSVIKVPGTPVPQGSVTPYRRGDGGMGVKYSPPVILWRQRVTAHVREAMADGQATAYGFAPVVVGLTFIMPRPSGHYGVGKNRLRLLPSAPPCPSGSRGDLDKLIRAILDACTDAELWADDGQVVGLIAYKEYSTLPESKGGVVITVEER